MATSCVIFLNITTWDHYLILRSHQIWCCDKNVAFSIHFQRDTLWSSCDGHWHSWWQMFLAPKVKPAHFFCGRSLQWLPIMCLGDLTPMHSASYKHGLHNRAAYGVTFGVNTALKPRRKILPCFSYHSYFFYGMSKNCVKPEHTT